MHPYYYITPPDDTPEVNLNPSDDEIEAWEAEKVFAEIRAQELRDRYREL